MALNGSWALLNLLAMLATVITAIGMILTYFRRKKDEENEYDEREDQYEEEQVKRRKSKFLGLIPAVFSVVFFFLTEDLTQKMVINDKWTPLMFVIFAIALILALLTRNKKEEETEAEAEA